MIINNHLRHHQTGQALVELILAIAIFVIIASSIAYLLFGSLYNNLQIQDSDQAVLVNAEAFTAIQSIGNKRWVDLICTSTGISLETDINKNWEINVDPYNEDLLGKYDRTVSIYGLFRDPNGDLTLSSTTIDAFGDKVWYLFENNMRLVIATTTWEKIPNSDPKTIVEKRYISNWNSLNFADDFTDGFSDGGTMTDLAIDTNGIKLGPDGYGGYMTEGQYISRVMDTESGAANYNFITWDLSWSN